MLNDQTVKKILNDPIAQKKFIEDAVAEYKKNRGKNFQEHLGILISKYKQEGGIRNDIKVLFLTFIKLMFPLIYALGKPLGKALGKFNDKVLKPLDKALKPLYKVVDKVWKPFEKVMDKVLEKTLGKVLDKVLEGKVDIQLSSSSQKKFDEKFANDKAHENLSKKRTSLRKKPENSYVKGSTFDFIAKSVSNVKGVVSGKSPLETFVNVQKGLLEFSRKTIENFSPDLIKDPDKAIRKAEKSIKDIQKKIENVKQMQRSGKDTTLRLYEEELQKLSPQQRKELEKFISPENRIKIWEENIKADRLIIEKARVKIKLASMRHKPI